MMFSTKDLIGQAVFLGKTKQNIDLKNNHLSILDFFQS